EPEEPIVVYIDSYGGYVDSLASMVETLDSVNNKVITVCVGKAMSCGAILLSCGDERYVAPSSRVMVHEVSAGAWGNVNDIEVSVEETKRLNSFWMSRLAENCGMKLADLKRLFGEKRDIYMTAKEALKFGIADKIGAPRLYK